MTSPLPHLPTNPTLQISLSTLLSVLGLLGAAWLIWTLRDLLILLLAALLISALLRPLADRLALRKVPRALTVAFIYTLLMGGLGLIVGLLVPALLDQSGAFLGQLTDLYGSVNLPPAFHPFIRSEQFVGAVQQLVEEIGRSFSSLVSTLRQLIGAVSSVVIVLVLSFYLVVEEDALRRALSLVIPAAWHTRAVTVLTQVQEKLADWLRGQMILGAVVGGAVFIGLSLLGVPYALLIALLAALFEFIPYIGPWLAAIPAVLIALAHSPAQAFLVILMFVLLQQLENHLLVPKITQRTTGLNPLVSLIGLLVGWQLGGVIGGLLAVPIVLAVSTALTQWQSFRS